MAGIYLIIVCIGLVWFFWKQNLNGRMYPFVGISCLYGIWLLTNGQLTVDAITTSILAILVWFLASILWSESPYSIQEIFLWCSYFLVFYAARNSDINLVMCLLIPNGVILAMGQLIGQYRYKTVPRHIDIAPLHFPIFGNCNHNAAFLLVSFYASLWLALNNSIWTFIASFIIGLAILRSKCRGAFIAFVASLFIFMYLCNKEIIYYSIALFLIFGVLNLPRFLKGNYRDRIEIYKDAINRIHPRWLIGRGLNAFRATRYGRVHNDYLEMIGETGFVGLGLIIFFLSQLDYNPFTLCCLIAFAIHGLFFFPFREVHTAVPFWAIMGTSAPYVSNQSSMYVLRGTSILAVIFVIIFIFTVFCNLVNHKR